MEFFTKFFKPKKDAQPASPPKSEPETELLSPGKALHAAIAETIAFSIKNLLRKASPHTRLHMNFTVRVAGQDSPTEVKAGNILVGRFEYQGQDQLLTVICTDTYGTQKVLVFTCKETVDRAKLDIYEVDYDLQLGNSARLTIATHVTEENLKAVIAKEVKDVKAYITNVTSSDKDKPLLMTERGY